MNKNKTTLLVIIAILLLLVLVPIGRVSADSDLEERIEKVCSAPNNSELIQYFCGLRSQVSALQEEVIYLRSCSQDYTDNGNGTITDDCSNLMWQKTSSPNLFAWEEAQEYCNGLELANYDNWSLPSIYNLMGLIEFQHLDKKINQSFEFGNPSEWLSFTHWASTEYPPDRAWYVVFHNGLIGSNPRSGYLGVRCVRTY